MLIYSFPSVGPADLKIAIYGRFFNLEEEKGRSVLEHTLFATRHGIETLLRQLVIGTKQYPNIQQMVGTVTGVIPSETDSSTLQGVLVRTGNGEVTLPASLVVGL